MARRDKWRDFEDFGSRHMGAVDKAQKNKEKIRLDNTKRMKNKYLRLVEVLVLRAATSLVKFNAHADKRHCSVTFSMPRFLVLLKLCRSF